MKNKLILGIALSTFSLLGTSRALAQQGVSMNAFGTPAHPSAVLDLASSSQGLLVPRMSAAQRAVISNPAKGLLVFQTDGASGFYFFDGAIWQTLNSFTTAGGDLTGAYPSPNLVTTGVNAGTYGTSTQVPTISIDAKGRVTSAGNTTITGVLPGGPAGGDLFGAYPNPSLATSGVVPGIYGSATQVPKYTVDSKGRIISATNVTISGTTPGGAASGDLTGTYPAPSLAASGVSAGSYGSATEVPSYAVDSKGRITSAGNITISGTQPGGNAGGELSGSYPNPSLATTGVTPGTYGSATEVPSYTVDGKGRMSWAGNITITGTLPGGNAGGDLTGLYPNPDLAASGVTAGTYGSATQVPSYTVDSKGRITSAGNTTISGTTPGGAAGGDLTNTYPNPTVANGAITSAKVLDGTLTNADVSTTAAIAYSKLNLAGSVTNGDVATGAGIAYSKLNLAGSISVADHSATGTPSATTFLRGDNTWGTPTATGTAGGDLAGTYPSPTLAASGVTSGTYGSSTQVPAYTVDSKGRITGASNITITGTTPGGSAGGDLTGTFPNPTLAASGVTSGTYGSATQVPSYTVDSKGRITGASNVTITGTTPGGSAGGDLTGTFPNPTVANNAVTSAKILDGTVANADISATAAIAYSKLALTGGITIADHSATGAASASTFLRGDNTWATPSGSPTGAASGDLSGSYPSPTIATSAVTSAKIADGTIALADLSATGTPSSSTYLRGDNTWATVTAGVSGSGTNNYHTKWTGTSSLGNSLVQDDGIGIAIGTTPTALHLSYFYKTEANATGDGQSAVYGYRTRSAASDGTGYGVSTSNRAVGGYSFWGDIYTYGTAGYNYNDYNRCGGVLGAEVGGAYWGALGYRSSGLLNYGVYGSAAYTSGTGFAPASSEDAGIGGGFFGMIGSVSKGTVIGQMNSGELFASYNMGDVYTSGRNIELVRAGEEMIPTYTSTSRNPVVYDKGTARMADGEVRVEFDEAYARTLGEAPVVTITPMGQCAGVYIASVDKNGFVVKELNDGHSSVQLSWIAVGNRVDAETKAVPEFLKTSTFDKNLSRVMHDDGDKKHSGEGMWWDGHTLQMNQNYPSSLNPSRAEKMKKAQMSE